MWITYTIAIRLQIYFMIFPMVFETFTLKRQHLKQHDSFLSSSRVPNFEYLKYFNVGFL